jgi:hypothetical protein
MEDVMGMIRFTFADLCALFTSNLPHVMVGLIDTSDAPPRDIHYPHIIIEEESGAIVGEYHGFNYHGYEHIYGDIFLDVHPDVAPLRLYEAPEATAPDHPRQSFNRLIDIERTLYPHQPLDVRAERCRARFHFRNGELYAQGPLHKVKYFDHLTDTPADNIPPSWTAAQSGLDVSVPDDGYAVLRFSGNTKDFVFKGGRNYKVTITNRAESVTGQHFQYFYRLIDQQPDVRLIPGSASPAGGSNLYENDPYCSNGWFALVAYLLGGWKK